MSRFQINTAYTFRQLPIGAVFDWIGAAGASYFRPCIKVSQRGYESLPERQRMNVGSLNAKIGRERYIVAYVGEFVDAKESKRSLRTWRGEPIGMCFLGSGWRVNSYIGERMYQIYATIDGREYTGRGFGKGMCVTLRPCAERKR